MREKEVQGDIRYRVGALMYTPALNTGIVDAVLEGRYGKQYSLALDLEDTIAEGVLKQAEDELERTLNKLKQAKEDKYIEVPMLFIRIRNAEHLIEIHERVREYKEILTGYILPKYSKETARDYGRVVGYILSRDSVWFMPTLESVDLFDSRERIEELKYIKSTLGVFGDRVLNIRVGGNDMCNAYGLRRHIDETIYDIGVVRSLLEDILLVFSREYVVSGPVWEYFDGGDEWRRGLERELELDRLNGFIGKTVIHPKQIEVVLQKLKVTREDYNDAIDIQSLSTKGVLVGRVRAGRRMNEAKTHKSWADKTLKLAKIYGVRE